MTTDIQPHLQPPRGQGAGLPGRGPARQAAIGEHLLIANGATGSMLQAGPTTLDDFAGYEGCKEPSLRERSADAVIAHHTKAKYFST